MLQIVYAGGVPNRTYIDSGIVLEEIPKGNKYRMSKSAYDVVKDIINTEVEIVPEKVYFSTTGVSVIEVYNGDTHTHSYEYATPKDILEEEVLRRMSQDEASKKWVRANIDTYSEEQIKNFKRFNIC